MSRGKEGKERTHSEENEDDVDPVFLYETLLRRRLDGLALSREWRRCAQLGSKYARKRQLVQVQNESSESETYRGGRVGVDAVMVTIRGAQTAAVVSSFGSVGHAPS